MATGFDIGRELLENAFFNTGFVGQNWIIQLAIIFATLLIITRHWQDWGELALPVMVGWKYFGMPVPFMFLTIASISFVMNVLSTKVFMGAITSVGSGLKIFSRRERVNVKREMEKYKVDLDKYEINRLSNKEKLSNRELRKFAKVGKRVSERENREIMKELSERSRFNKLVKERFKGQELEELKQENNDILNELWQKRRNKLVKEKHED